MARYKDENWVLAEDVNADGKTHGLTRRCVAVLMDIRDELKRMNAVLNCPNFIAVPRKLDRIAKNTMRRRAAAKPKVQA